MRHGVHPLSRKKRGDECIVRQVSLHHGTDPAGRLNLILRLAHRRPVNDHNLRAKLTSTNAVAFPIPLAAPVTKARRPSIESARGKGMVGIVHSSD